ncbi:MAG TPA: DUF4352 domain-containing protein [Caldithrix abyssi]|uniref:DUF4352 domain-containing protein n=1 Tax=Caldithrix abyssi TaxID=187145 RepID=A0A7V5RNS7_CALAY|nr:DUF4352 domain-containing protein [Caldithrix abyssi]
MIRGGHMRYLSILGIVTIFILLYACGGSEMEQGDKSYAEANYTLAINHYLKFKKDHPDDPKIKSKLALAYFQKGKELYTKTKNIKSFAGNYAKAESYVESPGEDPNFNKAFSSLLYELAIAYQNARPENEVQKEQYFNNTLDYLNLALEFDGDNEQAETALQKIYDENFEAMFNKGVDFYKRARREKNNDLYLSAEYYLSRADHFNPGDPKTEEYLSKVRKQTLSILKNSGPVSFCVVGYKKDKGYFLTDITASNFTSATMEIDPNNFQLELDDGSLINMDGKKTADFDKALTTKTALEPRKLLDGVLAFKVPAKTKVLAMIYTNEDGREVRKYFP